MQTASRKILAISALAFASAAGSVAVHAETYDGVLTVNPIASRQEVAHGAVEVARAGNVYGETASGGLSPVPAVSMARADAEREAVAIAQIGNPYGEVATAGFTARSVGAMPVMASMPGDSTRRVN
jgi:hypothetical protein